MDTSNPVMTGERVTLGDFQNANIMLRRQDFKYLNGLVQDGRRVDPELFEMEELEVDDRIVAELEVSGIQQIGKGDLEIPLTATKDSVLIGTFHPNGICQSGAHVSVIRTFPQRKRVRRMLRALLAFNPMAGGEIEKVTFSGGTKGGFVKRLMKWSSRKPVLMNRVLGEYALDAGEILAKAMPVCPDKLVDWHQGVSTLLSQIKITRTSGAGPPFFQQKYRCMDEIMKSIDLLVNAISSDTVDKFFTENPEFILSECKNKMDRYEVSKINEKTRPYWSFSAPVMFLISIIVQSFCEALYTFETKGSNAYGFSWAHGGAQKIWDWMLSCKEKERKFIVYGDDTKLVWRKEGKLYEVNPDFEQMDGSVDRDTVNITVSWVVRTFTRKYGKSDFFEYVMAMWGYLALGSEFFVQGTKVYSNSSGLLTGVVGTTLFDTVKSVLAYSAFVHQRVDPLDVKESTAFFRKMGLIVKEGTWKPQLVLELQEEGTLCSEEKFLGAKLMVLMGQKALECVPYVTEDDLLKLIGNMRQQEAVAQTTLARRLFDTARGYMITGAYHHPRIWNAMAAIVRDTPNEVVVQRVQADSGRGERPEHEMICGKDFRWPTSDGFPTVEFCKNVFLSNDNKFEGEHWKYIFPDLKSQLKAFRSKVEHVEPSKPKISQTEGGMSDWNEEIKAEQTEERIQDKIDPPNPVEDIEVLTRAKWKPPRSFVKFRKMGPEDAKRKEQRLSELLESVDAIHHSAISLVLPYGGYWITQQMLTKPEWHPTAKGFWTRDQMEAAKHVTSAWGYDEARAFGEEKTKATPTASSISTQPDVHREEVVVGDFLPALGVAVMAKADMDDVSFVSATFVNGGCVLETTSAVLSQLPARVKVTVGIKATDVVVGYAVSTSAKEAKRKLMAEVRRKMEDAVR